MSSDYGEGNSEREMEMDNLAVLAFTQYYLISFVLSDIFYVVSVIVGKITIFPYLSSGLSARPYQ